MRVRLTTVHARWKGRLAQWKEVRLKKIEEKLARPSAVSCCWHSPVRPCVGFGLGLRPGATVRIRARVRDRGKARGSGKGWGSVPLWGPNLVLGALAAVATAAAALRLRHGRRGEDDRDGRRQLLLRPGAHEGHAHVDLGQRPLLVPQPPPLLGPVQQGRA